MPKSKTSKLERAKKGGKGSKPGRPAVPPGWIQGDFLPSTMMKEDGLDLVENDRPTSPRILTIFEDEKAEVEMFVGEVISLVRNGLTGMDLLETFLSRRIQPLRARDHAMWHYSGSEDSTRSHHEEVSEETVSQWIKSITGPCDNPVGSKRVMPYSAENKPRKMEWTNLHSPVPNGEQSDLGAESEGGSAESEYVDDSEESEDASDDNEEEEQPPPRREPRSKQRHNPTAVPSKTVASSSRNVKCDRAAATDSAEKAAKQPKLDAPKLHKSLPRMRISMPVASA
ncbi:hypothetical protein ZWY2020_039845 [Hordeum vulgare]|nr:hypothetical protein ZWY2020_039845 [Hordeum vulgare]